MRVVLTGRWARGRRHKSLEFRLAANSQHQNCRDSLPGDTGKGTDNEFGAGFYLSTKT